MYPIFPWVISDYSSQNIDFSNLLTFRDLSKPIGALNKTKLKRIKKNIMLQDYDTLKDLYLYNSGYSSPLYIYHWLLRVEPFTTLHIKSQSGKFDHPSRIFRSVSTTYKKNVNEP